MFGKLGTLGTFGTFGSVGKGKGNSLRPHCTVPPVVTPSGNSAVGTLLSCTTGTWTNSPSFAYQWTRNGVNIGSATSATYTSVSGDDGKTLACIVTATANSFSVSVLSNNVTAGSIPTISVQPIISGSTAIGSTLTCTSGTWLHNPDSYTYQWKRGGSNIAGQVTATYVTSNLDSSAVITCAVVATNSVGNSSASTSSNSITVDSIPVAPANNVLPQITGSLIIGSILTCSTGTWTGYPTPTYAYQWFSNGVPVGTNSNTYTTDYSDVGFNITCRVTATNTSGSVSATSAAAGPIIVANGYFGSRYFRSRFYTANYWRSGTFTPPTGADFLLWGDESGNLNLWGDESGVLKLWGDQA